jgi:cyclic pyranopterin phosphate synthase
MNKFSHLDKEGDPSMVDISSKEITQRQAIARTTMHLSEQIMAELKNDDIVTKKGSVFQIAKIAGIMAVKRTSELIPLCHPLSINKCSIDIELKGEQEIFIICTVKIDGKTGVEMEALTGATVAALTIYDMCKSISHKMIIKETVLIQKSGGKSDIKNEF